MPTLLIAIHPTQINPESGAKALDEQLIDAYKKRIRIHNNESQDDSGFDILVANNTNLTSTSLPKLVDSGINAEMIEDDGSSGAYWLVPRSSICKVPLRQHNGVGVIDRGYRGPIKIPIVLTPPDALRDNNFNVLEFVTAILYIMLLVCFENTEFFKLVCVLVIGALETLPLRISLWQRSNYSITVQKESRYFQLVHPSGTPFKVKLVQFEELSTSSRGANGFGSTGNSGGLII